MDSQRKGLLYNSNTPFNKEDFINNVCNDKYVLVIGSEVILDKEKHSDVNGDMQQYILKALNNNLGRKDKPFKTLNALMSSRPAITTPGEPNGADLIRNFLFPAQHEDEDSDDDDEVEDDMDADDIDINNCEEEEIEWMNPPTFLDISPELCDLIDTKLFRFVMTTTFDGNLEFLMRMTWKDELRVVNIADSEDWKTFKMEVANTLDRNNLRSTTYKWNRPTLIYIFGKATKNKKQNFVKTENDAIEFIEKWMKLGGTDDPVIPMIMEKRILSLGCKFDDWYFRFFWYILKRDFERLGDGEVALSLDKEQPNDLNLKKYLKRQNIRIFKDARQFMRDICQMLMPDGNNEQSRFFYEIMKRRRGNGEIFISYSSADFVLASRLFLQLTDRGYNVWFDHESLCGGDYKKVIEVAINKASIVITLLTPKIAEDLCNGQINHFYNYEWRLASQLRHDHIIPLAANGYDLRGNYHGHNDNEGEGGQIHECKKITTYEDIIGGHQNGVDLMNEDFDRLIQLIDNLK